ncbi:MAG TPA: hypothetical protein VMN58_07595 [Acidimicrobiales bacterium]|nr:hypothetical protein [Acidimicrobiales bacterium]
MVGPTEARDARKAARWAVAFLFATPFFLLGLWWCLAVVVQVAIVGGPRDGSLAQLLILSAFAIPGLVMLSIWTFVGVKAVRLAWRKPDEPHQARFVSPAG